MSGIVQLSKDTQHHTKGRGSRTTQGGGGAGVTYNAVTITGTGS